MSVATLSPPPSPTQSEASASDVLDLDMDDLYEEIDGRKVVLPPMSAYATTIASRLCIEIGIVTRRPKQGEVVTETLFHLPLVNRARNRRPDLAFVSSGRWPALLPPIRDNAWDVVPDLVVEVISPNDTVKDLLEKIAEYLEVNVRQVWVIHPEGRLAEIHDGSSIIRKVRDGEFLDGGDIIPGFRLALAELLGPPQPVPPSPDDL